MISLYAMKNKKIPLQKFVICGGNFLLFSDDDGAKGRI
jgi:hypothetical protein